MIVFRHTEIGGGADEFRHCSYPAMVNDKVMTRVYSRSKTVDTPSCCRVQSTGSLIDLALPYVTNIGPLQKDVSILPSV
jgi:hypothetical protein